MITQEQIQEIRKMAETIADRAYMISINGVLTPQVASNQRDAIQSPAFRILEVLKAAGENSAQSATPEPAEADKMKRIVTLCDKHMDYASILQSVRILHNELTGTISDTPYELMTNTVHKIKQVALGKEKTVAPPA